MNLVKCEMGHFYDGERYPNCPHCAAPGLHDSKLTVPVMRTPASEAVTVAHGQTVPSEPASEASGSLFEAVQAASIGAMASESEEKTVGYFKSSFGTEPVVGWLVAISGKHFGEDFRLKGGRNFIGRAPGMDVSLGKDGTVSRERHAIVVYEPRGNLFIVQPGDSKELSYLNGEVVLGAKELKARDRLTVGETELMFIPCCSAEFSWEKVNDAGITG